MNRQPLRVIAALLVAGAAAGAYAVSTPPMDATTQSVSEDVFVRTWPAFGPAGAPAGSTSWHVTRAGGNCCEVYVAALPGGGLAEFGGAFPMVSTDRGRYWTQARPPLLLHGGEGAISAAPGGDIVGVTWDPYTGDRIIAYKYAAATGTWQYTETVLHEPFWDRPWLTVVPGPFEVGGRQVPYVTIISSNYHGQFTDVFYLSTDGLTYTAPSIDYAEVATAAKVSAPLAGAPSYDLDLVQPNLQSQWAPLPGRRAANFAHGLGCGAVVMEPDLTFHCVTGEAPHRTTRADSRGWLHEVRNEGATAVFRTLPANDAEWEEVALEPPLEDGGAWDFDLTDMKVSGRHGLAAVLGRVARPGGAYQDVLFRIDVRGARPRVLDVRLLGRGDAVAGDSAATLTGARVDFPSVAILSDGTVAATVHDSEFTQVALAVEIPGTSRFSNGRPRP